MARSQSVYLADGMMSKRHPGQLWPVLEAGRSLNTVRWTDTKERQRERVGRDHIMMQILDFTLSPMPLEGFK